MRRTVRKTLVTIAASSLAVAGLAACGSDEPEAPEPTVEETEEPEPEVEETEEPEAPEEEEPEAEEPDAPEGDGSAASWAHPVTTEGELLGTAEAGDVSVDIYLVAEDQSTRDSIWADPDTEEPIVQEGDDVLVLNYVVTNNGDPITLTNSLVEVGFVYDNWPFYQQPSVADNTVLESNGVNSDGIAERGEDVYVLGTGESYSVGQVMLKQDGEPFTVEVEVVLRDDAGERTGDSLEGEFTGTLD